MTKVLVSVIIPCYKQAEYLPIALQSVLQQSYLYWECIIVDDESPDDTKRVADEWLLKDARFKYIKIKNGGLSNARNVGIDHAIGEVILPLDADDKIGRDYLELAVGEFKKKESLKVVYCRAEKFGYEEGLWDLPEFSLKKLAETNMLFCSSLFYKRDWFNVGGYDVNMVGGLEDWEFWIAMLKNGGEVKQIDKVCFYYRIKSTSMLKNLEMNNHIKKKLFEYMSLKHVDFYVNQLGSFYSLSKEIRDIKKEYRKKTTNKRNVLNLFFKIFFGFNLFKSSDIQ